MSNSEKPQKSKFKLHKRFVGKKLIITSIVGVLFIAGILFGLYMFLNSKQSLSQPTQNSDIAIEDGLSAEDIKRADELTQKVSEVQNLIDDGKMTIAISKLDDAVSNTNDTYSKSFLLLSKATIYSNEGKYDEALVAAMESESLVKDSNVEKFIASVYEKKGDKQSAVKYYKESAALIDETIPQADSLLGYLQYKIKELGGGE